MSAKVRYFRDKLRRHARPDPTRSISPSSSGASIINSDVSPSNRVSNRISRHRPRSPSSANERAVVDDGLARTLSNVSAGCGGEGNEAHQSAENQLGQEVHLESALSMLDSMANEYLLLGNGQFDCYIDRARYATKRPAGRDQGGKVVTGMDKDGYFTTAQCIGDGGEANGVRMENGHMLRIPEVYAKGIFGLLVNSGGSPIGYTGIGAQLEDRPVDGSRGLELAMPGDGRRTGMGSGFGPGEDGDESEGSDTAASVGETGPGAGGTGFTSDGMRAGVEAAALSVEKINVEMAGGGQDFEPLGATKLSAGIISGTDYEAHGRNRKPLYWNTKVSKNHQPAAGWFYTKVAVAREGE